MKLKALKPQMTQMGADVIRNVFICDNLRHLRLAKMGGSYGKFWGGSRYER